MTDPEFDRVPMPGSLAEFLRELATSGEVTIHSSGLDHEGDAEALAVLASLEEQSREELAGEPPRFDETAALWAARQFYEACRFLVCRDIPAEEVTTGLGVPCPQPRGPSTDYSVDLTFRFLPDLLNLAERTASGDALTSVLRDWARNWPLSSVGALVEGPFDLEPFAESRALLQLYADRIVQHAAAERLDDARVLARVRGDIGAYPDLAPALASRLTSTTSFSAQP